MSSRATVVGLERALGPVDAAAIVISNVIGVGIFTTPGIVARIVPSPPALLGLWLAGGLLAFAGAGAYAELAALRPRAGGEYVYLREAFGPLAGFLTGWTSFVAGFSGAIAAGAVGLAAYLGFFFPQVASAQPLVSFHFSLLRIGVSPARLVALAAIFAAAVIHARGLGPGRRLQNLLTGMEVAALAALVAVGFAFGRGSGAHLVARGAAVHPWGWLLALIPVMFTYSGWNAAAYVAEEVRQPERNVPRALALGALAVTALYLALNALYLFAAEPAHLAGVVHAGSIAAGALFGRRGAVAVTGVLILALAGSLSAMTLAGPRVYFAMARDGLFPRSMARLDPLRRAPTRAIYAQAAWSGVLVLTGTFEQILIYTGFALVLFSGLAVAALFVLRRRLPDETRPFRAPGYPLLPGLFLVASLGMLASALWQAPRASGVGLGVIAAGIPLYAWWRRRATV